MFSIQGSSAIIVTPSSNCSAGLLGFPAGQLPLAVDGDAQGNVKDEPSDLIAGYVSDLEMACENDACCLAGALATLTVEDMWLDGSGETFDKNSNLSGHIARVRHAILQ
jgi:hypothetical protein